jgi:hypothetical protein
MLHFIIAYNLHSNKGVAKKLAMERIDFSEGWRPRKLSALHS